MPDPQPTLSVIITSFNYERYIGAAIDSVLSQADDRVQLVVVDDVSSDDSRQIITAYGNRLLPVFHEVNMGHGGAFNSGFAVATGDLVMFLDADDFLLPGGIETIRGHYDMQAAIYHYRMRYADSDGTLGELYPPPQETLASGEPKQKILDHGRYDGTLTSGLVFGRWALEKTMPMDSEEFRQGGDGYLSSVVPLYGKSLSFETPVSAYRRHESNHSRFHDHILSRARWAMEHDKARHRAIAEHTEKLGLTLKPDLLDRDVPHLEHRLTSILLMPETHPVDGDTRASICRAALAALPADAGMGKKLWWRFLQYAPRGMARSVLIWKIHAPSRPRFIVRLARFLRTRLGVTLR